MPDRLRLITDERMLDHDAGPGHPERPERLRALLRELTARTPSEAIIVPPREADVDHLRLTHESTYVAMILGLAGRCFRLDIDTVVSERSITAARLAAGAAIDAVDAVLEGVADCAFALGRPPGHHAEYDRAMGFCLFNNIALAAEHAIRTHGLDRVLIIDWDVHHGNGTQHAFYDRRDVLYFSAHQWPLFPGTGSVDEGGVGAGRGFTVNAPFAAGHGDEAYVDLFQRLLIPIADEYRPQLVLVSAGFDAHLHDPLGGMRVTAEGFACQCRLVQELAERHAEGRLALLLEGGYDIAGLVESVVACIEVLTRGRTPSIPEVPPCPTVDALLRAHRRAWPVLPVAAR